MEVHRADGAEKIARKLGRSVHSVETQASKYGISLRKRYHCPKCGFHSFVPLSASTGWCRSCTLRASREKAESVNRELRKELAEEQRRIEEAEQKRQKIYADSDRKRKKLWRYRES